MEQNPREKLPSDYIEYPGKMVMIEYSVFLISKDHATAVVLRVTKYSKEMNKNNNNSRRNSESPALQKK